MVDAFSHFGTQQQCGEEAFLAPHQVFIILVKAHKHGYKYILLDPNSFLHQSGKVYLQELCGS